MWRAVARDADTRLATRDGALGWLKEFAPELWVTVGDKSGGKRRKERIHGWKFRPADWERFRRGVQAVKEIADARDAGRRVPEVARLVAQDYFARHVRVDPMPNPAPTDHAPGFLHYFVRRGNGPNGAEVVSSVNDGKFDSPDGLMAYALASAYQPDVIPSFGGRCPLCRRLTGKTPKGKPRVGLCGKCKMAQWRAENPAKAKKQRAALLSRKRKAAKSRPTTNPYGGN
jgi:hypothetical protein